MCNKTAKKLLKVRRKCSAGQFLWKRIKSVDISKEATRMNVDNVRVGFNAKIIHEAQSHKVPNKSDGPTTVEKMKNQGSV
jgi:hypothetical protein